MRVLRVYLTLLILLAVSIGAGMIAADWPSWCHARHWCAAGFPSRPGTMRPAT
jgi:hypothetical protein